ncbi:MAG: type IV pilus secretin PilQ, partial [Sulfuricella sp.]|nr:type IV pilus secretin PilQ [Sulfuricella sp.]
TKQITTQVLVENGGTVVIGGIFNQEEASTVTKVPLLGDIPVLGLMFRNTDKRNDKRELLIFVTPKILKESLNLR